MVRDLPPTVMTVFKNRQRDVELYARLDVARPRMQGAAELARPFGLRKCESFWVEIKHVTIENGRNYGGPRFDVGESKSGNKELAHGDIAGWKLLMRLVDQACARGQQHLVTRQARNCGALCCGRRRFLWENGGR